MASPPTLGDSDLPTPNVQAKSLSARLNAHLQAAEGAFSASTERALLGDTERFTAWCQSHSRRVLPARAPTVVAYIEAMSLDHAPATVRRYVSSIATVHKVIGAPSPLGDLTVKLALQRMHRRYGRRQRQVMGLTWALRCRLLEAPGQRLIDVRNHAMLATAYDTLLRRSELVSALVIDLMIELDGTAVLLVRRSKTDTQGAGALLYLHPDSVRLVRQWLESSGVTAGPLFRSIRKDGRVGGKLDPSQVPRIYKAMAKRAGLPGSLANKLSGHSPRVGAVQDMIALGVEISAILHAGRWKSPAMVQRYGEKLLARRSGAAQLARLQGRE